MDIDYRYFVVYKNGKRSRQFVKYKDAEKYKKELIGKGESPCIEKRECIFF